MWESDYIKANADLFRDWEPAGCSPNCSIGDSSINGNTLPRSGNSIQKPKKFPTYLFYVYTVNTHTLTHTLTHTHTHSHTRTYTLLPIIIKIDIFSTIFLCRLLVCV